VSVNIQYVLWLACRHGDACATSHSIVNNAVFHSSPQINQMLLQVIHILRFCLVDSLLNCAADFEVNWIEVVCLAATDLEVHRVTTISEIIALSE